MKTFKTIPVINNDTPNINSIDLPIFQADISSSAELVVNDLRSVVSQMIAPDTSIDEALIIMRQRSLKSKLYVGTGAKLLGVVDRYTLVSRNVLMIANRKGLTRNDLTVTDVMNVIAKMPIVRQDIVRQSCIGDILFTMQKLGESHLQIIDNNNKICGLVSAIDISIALDRPVEISVTAHSFKDCFDVIHDHTELI